MGTDIGVTHLSRRTLLRLALATPLAAGIAAPNIRAVAAPDDVGTRVHHLRLRPDMLEPIGQAQHRAETLEPAPPGHVESAATRVLGTGSIDAEPFRLAALTWAGARPSRTALLVRARNRDGQWSGWTRVIDDGHGPDPGTPEARRARRGTDAIIVDESDAVEVRVETPDGALPDDLRLELIHPGSSQADTRHDLDQYRTAAAPAILRRADWGADESLRESGNPRYGEVRGAFVHHTAGSNSYTAADVPGIIRGIYAYHVEGRGWRDIGYNFLVDKFGRIWEGRFGGIDKPVQGAHVAGYNAYAFGTSVLGTYVNNEPEQAVLDAFAEVIAWKFDVHDVDPTKVSYPGLKDVPAIAGHRDGGATQCPGDRLYAKLSEIRGAVAHPPQTATLTLTTHTEAVRAGKQLWFSIDWSAGDEPVSGRVTLQRLSGESWTDVRSATVRDGRGVTFDLPYSDTTYRVRAITGSAPGATSEPLTISAIQSDTDLTMTRGGPAANGEIPIVIDWWHGASSVTGEVELQYFRDGAWQAARTADVTDGSGSTVLKPTSAQVYRLRAISVTAPADTDLGHPAGTSNEFRTLA